jgi:hypothetical protein
MLIEDREMLDLGREDGLQRHRRLVDEVGGPSRRAGLSGVPRGTRGFRRIAEAVGAVPAEIDAVTRARGGG